MHIEPECQSLPARRAQLPRFKSQYPTEHTGLAEYSRSFEFFRQVCEPPVRHVVPSLTRGIWIFNIGQLGHLETPRKGVKIKHLNSSSCFMAFGSSVVLGPLYGTVHFLSLWPCNFPSLSISFLLPNSSIKDNFFPQKCFLYLQCHASHTTVKSGDRALNCWLCPGNAFIYCYNAL